MHIFEISYAGLGAVDYMLFILRVATGIFFAISGYHKLFNTGRREMLRATFEADGIPFIKFCMFYVPLMEFIGGLFLTVGFLTVSVSFGLYLLLLVALCVDGRKRVAEYEPIDFADKVCDYLYLSETIYMLVLMLIMATGSGVWSIDYLLVR